MGRSYWFECARCGYRAKVSGGSDRGADFFVQTIVCQDCRELYDAVIRLRIPDLQRGPAGGKKLGLQQSAILNRNRQPQKPPSFQGALNRLRHRGHFKWAQFKPQCPVSPLHHIKSWNEPGKCPRCGLFLDKNALPYRLWD
ncbi:MAG TPA: hypothetical protein VG146_17700 [Verrucomicrobiae bacterium]|nr:hypothetical protein [Verrucomicrobiae bacterium]